MFDIGWIEVVVVIIVGCLVLEVKDIPEILKVIRKFIRKYQGFVKEIKESINEIDHEAKNITKTITDLEGNKHIAYDLDDITPDIKKSHDDQSK